MLDSRSWKCPEPGTDNERAPRVHARLEGGSSAFVCPVDDGTSRRGTIASAEGVVRNVADDLLELEGHVAASRVTLRLTLPREIDLRPLEGRRVRVTVREAALAGRAWRKARAQTLTIQGSDDRERTALGGTIWITAHCGLGAGAEAGPLGMTTALSNRSDGPLVFGTSRLKCAVNPGEHVRVGGGDAEYVMYFVERRPNGVATYLVAHASLWSAR